MKLIICYLMVLFSTLGQGSVLKLGDDGSVGLDIHGAQTFRHFSQSQINQPNCTWQLRVVGAYLGRLLDRFGKSVAGRHIEIPAQVDSVGYQARLKKFIRLDQQASQYHRVPDQGTVLYLGSDSAMRAALFPRTRIAIHLNDVPFLNTQIYMEAKTITVTPAIASKNPSHPEDLSKHPMLAPPILGGLLDSGYRILSVTAFTVKDNYFYEGTDIHVSPRIHGLVTYDRGKGTLPRYYIYIHGTVLKTWENTWWARELTDSASRFSPHAVVAAEIGKAELAGPFYQRLLEGLLLKRGLLVRNSKINAHDFGQNAAMVPGLNVGRQFSLESGESGGETFIFSTITP